MPEDSPKTGKRRWLQFSLRMLIVFTVVVSAGLAWIGKEVARLRRQRNVVALVEKAGGFVYYDHDIEPPTKNDNPPRNAIRLAIGKDAFVHVKAALFILPHSTSDLKAGLVALAELPHLRELTVNVADDGVLDLDRFKTLESVLLMGQFNDASLENMAGLSNLTTVGFFGNDITDAGLEHLKGLRNLESLIIHSSQITDSGLVHLKPLTRLRSLSLDGTQITDAGLVHLSALTKLNSLSLDGTQITDLGMVHLKELPNLKTLSLAGTGIQNRRLSPTMRITDAGLQHLKGLTLLEELLLPNTQITDAGLVHLNGLTNLSSLDLRYSQVSYEGAAELQKALPNCSISIGEPFP